MRDQIVVGVVFTGIVAASALTASATDDPIVYWSFDNPNDVGHDDSGNGHHLAIPGPWTSVEGPVGNAITFSENTSGPSPRGPYVSTSGLNYPGPEGFTVAYWATVDAGADPAVRDYWQHVASGEVFGLRVTPSADRIDFFVRHAFAPPTIIQVPASPYAGQWIHVAGVYKPTGYEITLYVNGEPAAQSNLPAPMRASIPPYLYTCGSWHGTNAATVDEVRIYDRALSPGEIRDLALASEPDADSDGIPDNEDNCPTSDVRATIVIDGCDTLVTNSFFEGGCFMSDLIADCAQGAQNHGGFVSCVAHLTNQWKREGLISGREKGRIQSCAATAAIP